MFVVPSERGLTLTELMIVGMLATIVMLALTGFYFNSQRVWMDSSTKALAQRDGSLILDHLAQRVHEAGAILVTPTDALHDQVALYDSLGNPTPMRTLRCEADSRIHEWEPDVGGVDLGPIADSKVVRLQAVSIGDTVLALSVLELVSEDGQHVKLASRFRVLGR